MTGAEGNCAAYCVARFLDNGDTYIDVRRNMVHELTINRNKYEGFAVPTIYELGKFSNYKEYLIYMAKNGAYITHQGIAAISNHYNIDIKVYQFAKVQQNISCLEPAALQNRRLLNLFSICVAAYQHYQLLQFEN